MQIQNPSNVDGTVREEGNAFVCRIGFVSTFHAALRNSSTPRLAPCLTGHADVSHHGLLAVLDAADLGEVDVQRQEGHAAQEGQGSHGDAVVTGVLVAVEDAALLHLGGPVHVALVSDAAEYDHGKQL